jgi:hypothetical protein
LPRFLVDGGSGECHFGGIRVEASPLKMTSYGDNVGVCLQYKSEDDILGGLVDADTEALSRRPVEQTPADYRAHLMQRLKDTLLAEGRQEELKERIAIVLYKDGLPLESQQSMNLQTQTKYYVFIGASGPCEVSVNIGGKIFRAHHDEMNRGLIEPNQMYLFKQVTAPANHQQTGRPAK